MISVIIPYVRNRGYLREAIASVEAQTYTDWQIIEVMHDKTQGYNINRGLEIANGDYIKILHDDDILPPNSLMDLYEGVQGYDFVCGDQMTFGDEMYCPDPHIYCGRVPDFKTMLEGNIIYGGTTLYDRYVLDAVGGYDESLHTGEEYDLHLRLLSKNHTCNYIKRTVHHYRLHEFNKSHYMGPGEKKERREFIREIAKRYDRGNNI
jgi:glycosyltransferase involved in cell wall biosynthesis